MSAARERSGAVPGPVVALVALVAAVALVAPTPPATAQSEEPWRLPAGASRAALEDRYSPYWWENYAWSQETLSRRRDLTPERLAQVIERLRLVIAQEPRSDAQKRNRQTREQVGYFPYLYLSMAFAQAGDFDAASATLEREDAAEVRKSRDQGELYAVVAQTIEARRSVQLYARLYDWLDAVRQGSNGLWLAAGGESEAQRLVRGARERLQSTDPESLGAAMGPLLEQTHALLRDQIGERRSRMAALASDAWGGLARTAGIDPADDRCAAPSADASLRPVLDLTARFEACVRAADEAYRKIGATACDALRTAREGAASRVAALGRFGGSAEAPDPLPAACNADWSTTVGAELWTAVGRLDAPAQLAAYARIESDASSRIAELRQEKMGALAAVRDRIPDLPAACVRDLGLGEPARRLDAIRARLDEALDGGAADAGAGAEALERQIETEVRALGERAQRKVELVLAEKDACEGVQPAGFDRLPALGRDFAQGGGEAALDALCRAVRQAEQAIEDCWSQNIDAVRAKARGWAFMLRVAADWQAATGAGPACLSESAEALAGRVADRGRNQSAWIEGTLARIAEAEPCLTDYRERRDDWLAELQAGVTRGSRLMEGEIRGALADRAASVRTALDDGREVLDRVGELAVQPTDALEADTLRAAIEGAGLAVFVPDARWETVDAVRGADRPRALAALRDEAVDAALSGPARELAAWLPLVGRFAAHRLLGDVFRDAGAGRLDEAIGTLRAAQAGGTFPDAGRPAAVGHTALSYLLYCKWAASLALAPEGPAREALYKDASAEARRAHVADGTFQPPAALFPHGGFRDFFRTCCEDL